MAKSKIINDQERLDYQKRLHDFMQEINPKPSVEDVEKLRQLYLAQRTRVVEDESQES